MQALLEQLREDEARKDALEAQVKAEQQRAAEKLEEEGADGEESVER